MIHHSDPGGETDLTGAQGDEVRLRDEPRPPWFSLLVGFLFLDGLFSTSGILLSLPGRASLLEMLPPFSFMSWYAYEDPWGWAQCVVRFLDWAIPILQLAVAYSIWRTPSKIQRLVFIVGVALATKAALKIVVPYCLVHGYFEHLGIRVAVLADLALAVFAIWFVRRHSRLARPEATLLLVYLILTGVRGFGLAINTSMLSNSPSIFDIFVAPGSWSYVLASSHVVDILSSALIAIGGLLLLQWEIHIKLVSTVVVFASVLDLAMWLFRMFAGMWGPIPLEAIDLAGRLCPIAGGIVIACALARFAWRNVGLFARAEPYCRTCRYNLTGNLSGVCPECGTEIEQP